MSYIRDNLLPNEKLLYKLKPSGALFFPAIITFTATTITTTIYLSNKDPISNIILIVGITILGLSTLQATIKAIIKILTNEYAITDKRIISKTGFIQLDANEILLSQLESINTEQNIIQALLKIGTITFRGTGRGIIRFKSIDNPKENQRYITELLEELQVYS